jgi:endoglucanase
MMRRQGLIVAMIAGAAILVSSCATPLATPTDLAACQINLTQVGFLPSGAKRAILQSDSLNAVAFEVRDAAGTVIYSGQSVPGGDDAASGVRTHRLELPRDLAEGDGYVVSACGAESRPFAVRSDIYAGLSEDALRYFYHNRIGIEIEAQYVQGPEWARREALNPVVATCFSGKDMFGNEWPGCEHELDVTGSWFDAGDFGVYAVNMGISIWTLQHAYERLSVQDQVVAAGWADGRMRLPETGNGVSEILDEARWGMESLLRLQVPEGGKAWVAADGQDIGPRSKPVLTEIEAGGLVHHKLAGRNWPPMPDWPWTDNQERLLFPPSTAGTLALAATGAQCARLWAGVDDEFAGRCFGASERAYAAAKRHPDLIASNNFDGSGAYGDDEFADEFAWAALELYVTTGAPEYLADLRANPAFKAPGDSFGWSDVGLLPALTLATQEAPRDRKLADDGSKTILETAQKIVAIRDQQGYAIPLRATEYFWGSNSVALNRGLVLAAAYDLTGDASFRDAAVDAMDYVLGRNVLDQSYVSGYGARPMRAPHHRIWSGAIDPEHPFPPPGALSGGANNTAMADPVAMKLKGTCAAMACWADDTEAYALNEVAINWNAPLVALAIFLDQTERKQEQSVTGSPKE